MTAKAFKKNKIIKSRMKELGITQQQLAERMTNMTQPNLQYHLTNVEFDKWYYGKAREILKLLELDEDLKVIKK